jgi:hypothetical protein
VETAFQYSMKGSVRTRRGQLLDQIYTLRSRPSHSGIGPSGFVPMSDAAIAKSMRRALLSTLTRSAILAFLEAPRSFLFSHPTVDPLPLPNAE